MSKVHPAGENKWKIVLSEERIARQLRVDQRPSVLTVWKRSSMSFQGTDGFTVFDHAGRLAFRVDNYSRKNPCFKGGILLMDGVGKALLTLKPQVFSFQQQWNAYRGDEGSLKGNLKSGKVFAIRSGSTLFHSVKKGAEAEVFLENPARKNDLDTLDHRAPDFRIEGCFWRRNCRIRNGDGEIVANISRKKVNDKVLLGDDVFSLVVRPGIDAQLVMSFVVVLDRICVKPYAPVLCS